MVPGTRGVTPTVTAVTGLLDVIAGGVDTHELRSLRNAPRDPLPGSASAKREELPCQRACQPDLAVSRVSPEGCWRARLTGGDGDTASSGSKEIPSGGNSGKKTTTETSGAQRGQTAAERDDASASGEAVTGHEATAESGKTSGEKGKRKDAEGEGETSKTEGDAAGEEDK